jgi:hypothetical protein
MIQVFQFLTLDELVEMTDPVNRDACRRLMNDHRDLFRNAPGSGHNHQAWPGGYEDHITEAMNICRLLFVALESTGRIAQFPADEQFTLGDAMTVVFLHDIEKPWRARYENGAIVVDPALYGKPSRVAFARQKLAEYGVRLTPPQDNAFKYIEGIRDADYRPDDRIMGRLAAFCAPCDLWSARMLWDFPR